MVMRYLREVAEHADKWLIIPAAIIAVVPWLGGWWVERADPTREWPRWLDPAGLTAAAVLTAFAIAGYRAWRDRDQAASAAEAKLRARDQVEADRQPLVDATAEFQGNYSDSPRRPGNVIVRLRITNRSEDALYLRSDAVAITSWNLSPLFSQPGMPQLRGRSAGSKQPVEHEGRAVIPPRSPDHGLYVQIPVSFTVTTREDLARALKSLDTFSVSLRMEFSSASGPVPIERTAHGDFEQFVKQVLGWWDGNKEAKLLRIYGES